MPCISINPCEIIPCYRRSLVLIDKAFRRKTDELVQKHIGSTAIASVTDFVEINNQTLEVITAKQKGESIKVINLIKSIEKSAEDNPDDPFLIAMAERAKTIQENFENRQTDTEEALNKLIQEINENEQRKKEQARKGFDSLTFFGKRHYWQFLVSGYEFCCVYNVVNKICKIISLVS